MRSPFAFPRPWMRSRAMTLHCAAMTQLYVYVLSLALLLFLPLYVAMTHVAFSGETQRILIGWYCLQRLLKTRCRLFRLCRPPQIQEARCAPKAQQQIA